MTKAIDDQDGATPEQLQARPILSRYGAELALAVLVILTVGVIAFQHRLFGRDIHVSHANVGDYAYSGYADQVIGGKSTLTASSDPLRWRCDIAQGASTLFCGYEVVLDVNSSGHGADLRNLESVTLDIDYRGPSKTLRLYLKNEDPAYSKRGDRSTTKINKVEFSVHQGRQTVVLHPQDFSVADWWLAGKDFAPEQARTQVDNIVSVEVSSASVTPPGRYEFAINSLNLRRSAIGSDQLYLIILAVWAALLAGYMLLRVHRAHADAEEKARAHAAARDALARAKRAAEDASQAKSDFLASMSHELRTPLNAILGYAQLLQRGVLRGKELAAVRTIHRSGAHLLSLITDLLDLSKIEAGKMELHPAPANLRALIGQVVEMIGVRAEEKGLAFTCVIADDVPEAVAADDKRLRQVLLNLLSNAVKFTAEGRVALRVSRVAAGDHTATLRFEVQDSGPGIAEDQIEAIFRPFEQVGDLRQREGGTGLGLAISRQLAGLMGSDIQVQSRLGQGACFWFEPTFPIAEAPAPEAGLGADDIAGYAGPRRRILVVDDYPDNRALLCDLLEQLGFATDTACNGREAITIAQLTHPHLILMDLKMPVMNGYEATRLLRMIEPLKTTPILAVSANTAEDGEGQALAAGADGFVAKPVDNGELLAAIGRVLALDWFAPDGRAPNDNGQVEASDAGAAEGAGDRPLRILAADDNPVNQQVLRAMLQDLAVDLQFVDDGVEAVRAVKAGGFDLVLMDVQMPQMNGIEATRAIRDWEAKGEQARTPIVALSANASSEHQAQYLAAGMDSWLEKPIDIEQLYRLLEAVAAGPAADLRLSA